MSVSESEPQRRAVTAERRLLESVRVLVLGPSGSGKTTLSRRLASLLELEVIHLDAEFWKPGWVRTPRPEWRIHVASLANRPAWVMDGTYEDSLELRLPRAQTVIVMHNSRLASLWGIVQRRVVGGKRSRVDAPAGQRVDASFLRYVWRFPSDAEPLIERRIKAIAPEANRIDLRGRRDAARLLRLIEAHVRDGDVS